MRRCARSRMNRFGTQTAKNSLNSLTLLGIQYTVFAVRSITNMAETLLTYSVRVNHFIS